MFSVFFDLRRLTQRAHADLFVEQPFTDLTLAEATGRSLPPPLKLTRAQAAIRSEVNAALIDTHENSLLALLSFYVAFSRETALRRLKDGRCRAKALMASTRSERVQRRIIYLKLRLLQKGIELYIRLLCHLVSQVVVRGQTILERMYRVLNRLKRLDLGFSLLGLCGQVSKLCSRLSLLGYDLKLYDSFLSADKDVAFELSWSLLLLRCSTLFLSILAALLFISLVIDLLVKLV